MVSWGWLSHKPRPGAPNSRIYPLEIPESEVQVFQETLKGLNLLCVHIRDFLDVCLCLYSSVYDGTVTRVRAHLRNPPSPKDSVSPASVLVAD